MISERYLVRTAIRGYLKTQVWDSHTPLKFGVPFRWILEKIDSELVLKDRLKASSMTISKDHINRGARIKLTEASAGLAAIYLEIARVQPFRPAYLMESDVQAAPTKESKLFVFTGSRRSMFHVQMIHTAYVAYSRKRPIFILQQEPNDGSFRIKPLTKGVSLKLHHQKPIPGPLGEVWKLRADQINQATLIRKWNWWRFRFVLSSESVPVIEMLDELQKEEKQRFNKLFLFSIAVFLALGMVIWKLPTPRILKEIYVHPQILVTPPIKPNLVELPKVKTPAPIEVHAEREIQIPTAPQKLRQPVLSKLSGASAKKPGPARSSTASLNQSHLLKETVQGAAQFLSQKTFVKTVTTLGSRPQEIFAANEGAALPTTITPSQVGSEIRVKTVGGGNRGGLGYGTGSGISTTGLSSGSIVVVGSGGSSVEEGLTKEEVGAVIYSHMAEVRYCHESALLRNPRVSGKLDLQFDISPAGQVIAVVNRSSTVGNFDLENCIMQKLKTWIFPKPKGGIKVTVTYPFIFKVLSRGKR